MKALRMLPMLALLALAPAVRADVPLRQIIDVEVKKAWEREKITPAGRCDDAAFLRRVYLDLAGTVPTHDEAIKFLQDGDAQKREKLVDTLLAAPRFAAHQADVWDLTFFGRNPPNGDATRKRDGFKKWLAGKFAKNEPYDRWVRDLLLADQEGSELFFVQFRNQPEDATMAVSRIFLGTQLQCARCHDHPFASWTQKDFYGMAGFFVRLVVLDGAGEKGVKRYRLGEKSSGEVLFTGAAKDQKPGLKGEPVKAKFLGGSVLDEPALPKDFKEPELKNAKELPKPKFSRKEKIAEWVTAPANPYFTKAVANRVWGQFMGRGIVHPVDDFDGKNKPSHPELLEALTKQLAEHKYDLKWYVRELVLSETYQRSAAGIGGDALPTCFERARVRPLSAEEIMVTLRVVTGTEVKPGNENTEYYLRYFGEPMNGRGEFQGGLSEHLFLNNSSQLRQLIQRKPGNLADKVLTSTEPWEKRVDRLFVTVLSRLPKPEEQKRFVAYLTASGKPEALVEEERLGVSLQSLTKWTDRLAATPQGCAGSE
jgi:hypothetical protein